ncbi:hypothetical protein N9230_05820 [Akkermansiaceae bacterium]|nr:hypothetical protein [Akkermansiaceae bacterium]
MIRSIFVINMRGAGGHFFMKDMEWRALVVRKRSVMMFCQFEAKGVRHNGYGLSILRVC